MYQYLILIDPLGLLYASSGPFLSPENLVGLASQTFPPSSATFAGLMAAYLSERSKRDPATLNAELQELFVAGPFWTFKPDPQNQSKPDPQNFFVPTPFCYLAKLQNLQDSSPEAEDAHLKIQIGTVERLNFIDPEGDESHGKWVNEEGVSPVGKFDSQTWIPIEDWDNPKTVYGNPWKTIPHLHPRLRDHERHVMVEGKQGSLFLENAVQLHPATYLAYLSNTPIEDGWYRFGGEGHMVELSCLPLNQKNQAKFEKPLGKSFATITPGVWGSNRFSTRYPRQWNKLGGNIQVWTERAKTFRFRLGGRPNQVKRLSRGRYAVPAGTIYQLPEELDAWKDWGYYDHAPDAKQPIAPEQLQKTWFPTEGYSFKHWGCGLALPIQV